MNNDVIEQVRLLAPEVEAPSELARARQRRRLTIVTTAESVRPEAGEVPSCPQKRRSARRHASRRRVYLAAAAAVVAAAGTAIPLILGGSSASPVMQLASYRLRLPASYHLTAASPSNCPDGPFDKIAESFTPAYDASPEVSANGRAKYPEYDHQLAAAANAEGGCITMLLAPPYTPTTTSADPEAAFLTDAQPVKVGPYQGAVGTGKTFIIPADKNGLLLPETIYVEIPIGDGQYEDLVVNAYGISGSALVSLVKDGLSVAGSSATSGTPIGSLQGNTGAAGNSGTAGNTNTAGNRDKAGNSGAVGNSGAAGNSGTSAS